MDAEELENIVAAILTTGRIDPQTAPMQAVNRFAEVRQALRNAGGLEKLKPAPKKPLPAGKKT